MVLAKRQTAVHIRTESSPNVYETITIGTHSAIRVRDLEYELVGPDGGALIWRDDEGYADADGIGMAGPALGGRYWRITGTAEYIEPQTIDDLETTPIGVLVRGSPVTVTENGTTSVVLTPSITFNTASTPQPFSLRIDEAGGRSIKACGCVCKWSLRAQAGRVVEMPFQIVGNWVETPGSAGSLSSVLYNNNVAPSVFMGATLTTGVSGTTSGVASFEWDPSFLIKEREGAEGTAGYAQPWIGHDGPAYLRYSVDSDAHEMWGQSIGLTAETGASLAWGGTTLAFANLHYDTPKPSGDKTRKYDMEARVRGTANRGAHWTHTII